MEKRLEQTYRQDAVDEEHRKERLAKEEKQESAESIANRLLVYACAKFV